MQSHRAVVRLSARAAGRVALARTGVALAQTGVALARTRELVAGSEDSGAAMWLGLASQVWCDVRVRCGVWSMVRVCSVLYAVAAGSVRWQQSGAVLFAGRFGLVDAEAQSIVWSVGVAWRRVIRTLPRSVGGVWHDSGAQGHGNKSVLLTALDADQQRVRASTAGMAWREADGTLHVLAFANGIDGRQATVEMFDIQGTLYYEAEQQLIRWSNGAVWAKESRGETAASAGLTVTLDIRERAQRVRLPHSFECLKVLEHLLALSNVASVAAAARRPVSYELYVACHVVRRCVLGCSLQQSAGAASCRRLPNRSAAHRAQWQRPQSRR